MQTLRVVPLLDETGDYRLGFYRRSEGATIDEFAFERSEKALRHGVVVAVSHGASGLPHPRFSATLTEDERGVLGAVVRVMDNVARLAQAGRHLERIKHDLHTQAC